VAALLRVAIPTEGRILLAPVYVLPGRPPPPASCSPAPVATGVFDSCDL